MGLIIFLKHLIRITKLLKFGNPKKAKRSKLTQSLLRWGLPFKNVHSTQIQTVA